MAKGNHSGKGGFGEHPENRNNGGQRNKAAVAFARSLRELIVREGESKVDDDGKRKKKIEIVIRKLYERAIAGEGWAIEFIAERVEGKVKTEIGIDANMKLEGNIIRVRDIASEQKR